MIFLMLVFALTLWLMALNLARYSTELAAVNANVSKHIQLTMENRVIQAEIRGMLLEHRRTEALEPKKK